MDWGGEKAAQLRNPHPPQTPSLSSLAEFFRFCSGGDNMGNASGHQCKVKMSDSKKKKVNENTYDISSIKRVTKKFLEVSRCSRVKQRQRNVQKKCAAHAKLLFC